MRGIERIPLGLGRELNEAAVRLPAIKVANEVLWVDPEMQIPFNLVVGQPCELSFFLFSDFRPSSTATFGKTFSLEIPPCPALFESRGALLGRVICQDNQGNLYRKIDLKGVGRILWDVENKQPLISGIIDANISCPRGLAEESWIDHDQDIEGKFRRLGIRTSRTIAIIKLKEIVDKKGKIISVEEAKKEGILAVKREPAIQVRAFRTKFRLENFFIHKIVPGLSSEQDIAIYYKDALQLVSQELGIAAQEFGYLAYLAWFAENLGTQVGTMHKAGYLHNYLSPHNITVDCSLVDFDSVTEPADLDPKGDVTNTVGSLDRLIDSISYINKYLISRGKENPKNHRRRFRIRKELYLKRFFEAYLQQYPTDIDAIISAWLR